MRPAVFLTALMGAVAQADRLLWEQAWFAGARIYNRMAFDTDFGRYNIPTIENRCEYNGLPPGMTELCMDMRAVQNGRGHFKFSHQSFKRCLVYDGFDGEDVGGSWREVAYYREAGCTWRLAEGEADSAANVTVSELPAEPAATPAPVAVKA